MKTLKLEDLSIDLQKRITKQAEYQAEMNILIDVNNENESTLLDKLKVALKQDPYMDIHDVCQTVEHYNGYTVSNLLKEIELLKLGYVNQSLWAISLVLNRNTGELEDS